MVSGPVRPEVAAWGMASQKGWVDIDRDYLLKMIWVPCPPFFSQGEDRESWAAESAALWFRLSQSAYGRQEVDHLAGVLEAIHADVYSAGHCHQALVHLPESQMMPLPAQIGVWAMQGEREPVPRERDADAGTLHWHRPDGLTRAIGRRSPSWLGG